MACSSPSRSSSRCRSYRVVGFSPRMTAINVFVRPDAVHLFTDGAGYRATDGEVRQTIQKVATHAAGQPACGSGSPPDPWRTFAQTTSV